MAKRRGNIVTANSSIKLGWDYFAKMREEDEKTTIAT